MTESIDNIKATVTIEPEEAFQTDPGPGVGVIPLVESHLLKASTAKPEDYDLFLGLLNRLPQPDAEWPMNDRLEWLQAAEAVFKLMYKGADDGSIKIDLHG